MRESESGRQLSLSQKKNKPQNTGWYIEGVCGAEVGEIWTYLYNSEKEPVKRG